MTRRIIVIGSGAAGMTAASEARRYDPEAEITVLTEDEHIAYSPCAIPWVIEGRMDWKDVIMHDPSFYSEKRGIEVLTRTSVTSVDRSKRTVTAGDREYAYDSLVIATGGSVAVPPVEGRDLKGTFVVRTMNDAKAITQAARKAKAIAVVGAGVIGLEIALALRNLGKKVLVVEMFDQVIPRIFDADMSEIVLEELERKGVDILLGAPIGSVDGAGRVEGITAGDRRYKCDMVIFATGVRANLEVPGMMGLDVGALGAVSVSPTMQPYINGRPVDGVYAAGDVVQCHSSAASGPTMSQLGSTAVRQGIAAGRNAAGGNFICGPTAGPWISVIGDLQVGGAGLSKGLASWYGIRVSEGKAKGCSNARYYPGGTEMTVKLIGDGGRRIIGAQLVSGGDINGHVNWLSSVISAGTTVDTFLRDGENAYCPPTSMVRDVAFDAAEDLLDHMRGC